MSETVLKGGITYTEGETEYVWHTTDGACEKCQGLNGKVFNSIDDIPSLPHPNCKCWVEDREKRKENNEKPPQKDDEPCDCWKFFEGIDEIVGDINSVKDEIEQEQNNTENFLSTINNNFKANLKDEISKMWQNYNKTATLLASLLIFASNFKQLLDKENGNYDKYYHAKANCEAAQLGLSGAEAAEKLSNWKEKFDAYVKGFMESIKTNKEYKEIILRKIADGEDDQKANKEGREIGIKNPNGICGELLEYKLPNNK